ncbi:TonB-dependent receptor [Mucilaginibacter aquariorum]|uniref:TonB-dependent receptor n=1 Tax=Mucilaginibacter aquariorum TaxID=2967225 RepID=A0ABT1T8H3_9SPHI|nr:TonB-dependent receptor [Mucilaginibacter aquariorum]MCQ6960742.1 TonB-dependent receptor [Mucilaginibacter aquariorum]
MKLLIMAFLAIGLCFAPDFLFAQTISGKISGKVADENGRPVEGAAISLMRLSDSIPVKYELTLAGGSFNIGISSTGSFYLKVASVGKMPFQSGQIAVDAQHLLISLNPIIMQTSVKSLQEVVITSKKAFLEQKIDRTVVNVDALISNAGTTALEVLEKSPGVNIDQAGQISFHGKSGVAIYIDDKPTYLSGSDLENYLRSMPSSTLSQIELMTNPPAKYDAAGTAGIINIKTKKTKVKGFNLGMSFGLRQSRYTATNNSMDFNYRKDKINVFGTFAYTFSNGFNDIDINRSYFYNAGQPSGALTQNSYIRTKSSGYNAKLGMDLYSSENTTIGVLFNGIIRLPDQFNNSKGQLFNVAGQPDSSIISKNKEQGKFKNSSVNLNYKHTFKKDGPELTANLDYLAFATDNNQTFLNQSQATTGSVSVDQLNGNLPADIHIYSAKADYSQPLAGGWKLESGVKSSYTNTNNQANYFNIVNGSAITDNDKTNHFLYKEAINAGYVNLNKDFKRLSIQAGLRIENTDSRGHQLGNTQKPDSAFNRNYTGLFPTLYLLYKLDTLGDHQVKMTYGRRIERPYYQDLNPFISPLDKYTFYIGNPYLLPSYSGNVELGYIYKDRISVTITYTDIRDRSTETIEIRNGYYYSRPGNIGSTKLYALNADASFDPASWFSLELSGDLWQLRQSSDFYTGTLKSHSTSFSGQAMLQFKLNKGWTLQTDGKYQSKQTDAQFTLAAKGRLNIAVSKTLSPRATLKLSVNDILNTNINQGAINNLYQTNASFRTLKDSRAVLLTLSMRFGKAVKDQRKHNQTGAGEESDRVKN